MVYFLYGIIFIRCVLPIISTLTDTILDSLSLFQTYLHCKSEKIENAQTKKIKPIGFNNGDVK